jgi:hypothetical protein
VRLIGIGLLCLMLVGLALVLAERRHDIATMIDAPAEDGRIERIFRSASASDAEEPLLDLGDPIPFFRTEADEWLALTGFPAFAKATFRLPRDTVPDLGQAVLNLTSDILESGSGSLRISINGKKRGELILQDGHQKYRVIIPLTPVELASGEIVVSFSTTGITPSPLCGERHPTGSLVEIEPDSRIELKIDRKDLSVRDALLASGSPGRVIWPRIELGEERATRLGLALAMAREGTEILFIDEDYRKDTDVDLDLSEYTPMQTSNALLPSKYLISFTSAETGEDAGANWPLAVADVGDNAKMREFQNETAWRIPFSLNDTPEGKAPTSVQFTILASALELGDTWLLSVSQNERLIYSERIPANGQEIAREVALPVNGQTLSNEVKITLNSSAPRPDPCLGGPEAVAQLKDNSVLIGGRRLEESMRDVITGDLAADNVIFLRSPEVIGAAQANLAMDLLAGVVPANVLLRTDDADAGQHATATVVTGKWFEANYPVFYDVRDNRRVWLAWLPTDDGDDSSERIGRIEQMSQSDARKLAETGAPNLLVVLHVPAEVSVTASQ